MPIDSKGGFVRSWGWGVSVETMKNLCRIWMTISCSFRISKILTARSVIPIFHHALLPLLLIHCVTGSVKGGRLDAFSGTVCGGLCLQKLCFESKCVGPQLGGEVCNREGEASHEPSHCEEGASVLSHSSLMFLCLVSGYGRSRGGSSGKMDETEAVQTLLHHHSFLWDDSLSAAMSSIIVKTAFSGSK